MPTQRFWGTPIKRRTLSIINFDSQPYCFTKHIGEVPDQRETPLLRKCIMDSLLILWMFTRKFYSSTLLFLPQFQFNLLPVLSDWRSPCCFTSKRRGMQCFLRSPLVNPNLIMTHTGTFWIDQRTRYPLPIRGILF